MARTDMRPGPHHFTNVGHLHPNLFKANWWDVFRLALDRHSACWLAEGLREGVLPANHRQLSHPSSARKSPEKAVVYKAASREERNSWNLSSLWLELVPSPVRPTSAIGGGPVLDDDGNLTVQNPSGREPLGKILVKFVSNKFLWNTLHVFV